MYRFANRHYLEGLIRFAIEIRYLHRCFRWTVYIDQADLLAFQHPPKTRCILWLKRFSTGEHLTQRPELVHQLFPWKMLNILEKSIQHCRYKVDHRNLLLLNGMEDLLRILFPANTKQNHFRTRQYPPEQLSDGHIEGDRCFLQYDVIFINRVLRLKPGQVVDNRVMLNHNSFWLAR
ncbi:hypothetical protein D1872_245000 [compost metagenome]